MKMLFKLSIVSFMFIAISAHAQKYNMIEACTDDDCYNVTADFRIQNNSKGFYFDFKLLPGWYKCDSTGSFDYNMVGIRIKNNHTFLYQYYLYYSGEMSESSDLSKLVLGPGEYELVVSSNRSNSVTLTYFTGSEITEIGWRNNFELTSGKNY